VEDEDRPIHELVVVGHFVRSPGKNENRGQFVPFQVKKKFET
jgi:hypothetical protein